MSAAAEAKKVRERFALHRAIVLEDVADGKRDAIDAIATLERTFQREAIRFFRVHTHASRLWNENGPLADLVEVRKAYVSERTWAALLDRVRKAREERTRDL